MRKGIPTKGIPAVVTLDDLFRATVRRRPAASALVDPPDRAAFAGSRPRTLTYAAADAAVNRLAVRLRELGLPAGSVIGVQTPNTVEAVITILGVMRAGMVVAPVPLLWRRAEAVPALATVGARAFIFGAATDFANGDVAIEIAAESFNIRFVMGFGKNLPDGAGSLDDIFSTDRIDPTTEQPARSAETDTIAVVTFDITPRGVEPAARTHGALMVAGLAALQEAGVTRNATLLSALLPSSFASLSATLVPWLLSGGTLFLHHPFDPAVLVAQCSAAPPDVLVLPGPVVPLLAEAGIVGAPGSSSLIAVWRAPDRYVRSGRWTGNPQMTDILAFGETGVLAMRRAQDGSPRCPERGVASAPFGEAGGTPVATLARSPEGTLLFGGPMLPRKNWHAGHGASDAPATAVDTGYPCQLGPTGDLTITGVPQGLIQVGGYRFVLRELQDTIARLDDASVVAALPDPLIGDRIRGTSAHEDAISSALAEIGMNLLIESGFRGRAERRKPAA